MAEGSRETDREVGITINIMLPFLAAAVFLVPAAVFLRSVAGGTGGGGRRVEI